MRSKTLLFTYLAMLPFLSVQASDWRSFPRELQKKTWVAEDWKHFYTDLSYYPYLVLELALPGVGVCARTSHQPVRFELNAKAASLMVTIYSATASALVTLKRSEGDVYLGLGGGIFGCDNIQDKVEWSPQTSLFLGHESLKGFFDLGADVVIGSQKVGGLDPVVVIPFIRGGIKF